MQISTERINSIVNKYPGQSRYSLTVLQDLQRNLGYIPRESLVIAAEYLGCSVAALYSMATFYKALSLEPKGLYVIRLCDGTACHIRGSVTLIDGVCRILGISPGECTNDGVFSLEMVNCLGACAMAPIMMVNDDIYGQMTTEKLPEVFEKYRSEVISR